MTGHFGISCTGTYNQEKIHFYKTYKKLTYKTKQTGPTVKKKHAKAHKTPISKRKPASHLKRQVQLL